MKYVVTLLFGLMFSFPVAAQDEITLQDTFYGFEFDIRGEALGTPGSSETSQKLTGISYEMYTVVYTVAVDAMREIITKAWMLESGGIPTATVQSVLSDPRSFLCE